MFRKYFDRIRASKRVDNLLKQGDLGTPLRDLAILKHRQYWPKTPYTREDDLHEGGFIAGYVSREDEVLSLKSELEYYKTLTQDIEKSNSVHFITTE